MVKAFFKQDIVSCLSSVTVIAATAFLLSSLSSNADVAARASSIAPPNAAFNAFSNTSYDTSYVEKALPELYQAAIAVLGEQRGRRFLAGWGPQELSGIFNSIEFFDRHRSGKAPNTPFQPQSPQETLNNFTIQLYGILGEVIGGVEVKRRFDINPESPNNRYFFLSEPEYRLLNGSGSKPDGLVYTIEGDRLLIHQILESKLGRSQYKTSQALGYLHEWQAHGIAIGDRIYRDIELLVDGKRVSIAYAHLRDLERTTLLVCTRSQYGRDRFDKTFVPPVSERELRTLSYRLLKLISLTKPSPKMSLSKPAFIRPSTADLCRNLLRTMEFSPAR